MTKMFYRVQMLVLIGFLMISNVLSLKVVLSFDDGWVDNMQAALDMNSRGIQGTFFINSDRVGEENRMTVQNLQNIYNMGHEIGGHTLLHENLRDQNFVKQKNSICDDRDKLLEWGFNVTNFAFPFGGDTPESFALLGMCGYNGARDSGGIKTPDSCFNCPKSDTIIPSNPQQIRSVSYRSTMGVEGLKHYVNQALNDPEYINGVLVLIFHEYGNYPEKDAYILPVHFKEFLDWLQTMNNVEISRLDDLVNRKVYPNFNNLHNPSKKDKFVYISLTFDDGTSDHLHVSDLLEKYDMRGTFFINKNTIGTLGYLTVEDLQTLEAKGHEIGGNGPNQTQHIVGLSREEQYSLLKEEFDFLKDSRIDVTSFAWPYGETSAQLTEVAKSVGYIRARDVGGLKVPSSCHLCPSTLEMPLSDASKMAIRSFNVKSTHSLGDLMWQVWRAEEWAESNPDKDSILVFTFSTVCDGCRFDPYDFEMFLQWLHPRYKIRTTNEKINFIV